MKLLNINNLNTRYKNDKSSKNVHHNLVMDIFCDEVVAIIGKNGCGKTTLVNSIANVWNKARIQDGEIKFQDNFNKRTDLGVQFQIEDNISDIIKVENLIKFYKKYYGNKVTEESLNEMIDVFGIRDLMKKKTSKLSGGQRQRLNLLLAVMHKPKLLILDEFTTGLDIISVKTILKYILKIKNENKSSILLISHQPSEIKLLADRVLVMDEGSIKREYSRDEIVKKYGEDFETFLLDSIMQEGDEYE